MNGVDIRVPAAMTPVEYLCIRPEEVLLSKLPFDSSARNQYRCRVVEWEHSGRLFAVTVAIEDLRLTALITHSSFNELTIDVNTSLYCTFKSAAVHQF